MRQARYSSTMFVLALLVFVWSCGGEGREPPVRAAEGTEVPPTQLVNEAPASTVEKPPLPFSMVSTTIAVSESDGIPVAMARPLVSYLEDIHPPCTPIVQSGSDPCESELLSRTGSSSGASRGILPDVLPTISEMVHDLSPIFAPHLLVRATGLPSTTRCDGLYPIQVPYFQAEDCMSPRLFHYYCFTDFRINEYIVGEGPSILTMLISGGTVNLLDPDERETIDEQWMKETFDLPDPEWASLYEGSELIIMLGIPSTLSIETWRPQGFYYSMWFITREGEDLRAVSGAIDLALTPEHHQQLNRPLNEVITDLKEAMENRATLTGGRIGLDQSLPPLVSDANRLQDFYGAVGAVYEGDDATLLPPPAPGDDDPEQDPTRTDENQPTSTIPAPGDEISPPPTDDATTTTSAAEPPAVETTTSTVTTQPEVEDTTPTGTTQPIDSENEPPNPPATEPAQPQTDEDTTTSSTGTTQPPDDTDTTQPQARDTIPTPTGTTQPPDNGGTTISNS